MSKRMKTSGKKDKIPHLKVSNAITKYAVPTSPRRIFGVKHRKEHRKETSFANSSKSSLASRNVSDVIVISDSDDDAQSTSSRMTRGQKSELASAFRQSKKTAAASQAKGPVGRNTYTGVAPRGKNPGGHDTTPQIQISDSHPAGSPKTPISPKKGIKVPAKGLCKSLASEKTVHSRFKMSLMESAKTPVLRSHPDPLTSTPDMKSTRQLRWQRGPVAQSTPKSSSKFNPRPQSKQASSNLPNQKSTPTADPKKIMDEYTKMLQNQTSITPVKSQGKRVKLFQSTPHKDNAGIPFPRLTDSQEVHDDGEKSLHHNEKDKNGNLISHNHKYLGDITGRRQLHEAPRIHSSDAFRPPSKQESSFVATGDKLIQKWLESGNFSSDSSDGKKSEVEKGDDPKSGSKVLPSNSSQTTHPNSESSTAMGSQAMDSIDPTKSSNSVSNRAPSNGYNAEGLSQGDSAKTSSSSNSNSTRSGQNRSGIDRAIDEFVTEWQSKPRKETRVFTDVSNNGTKTKTRRENSVESSKNRKARSLSSNSSSQNSQGARTLKSSQNNDGSLKLQSKQRNSDSENDPGCSIKRWDEQSDFSVNIDTQPQTTDSSQETKNVLVPSALPDDDSLQAAMSPVLLPSSHRWGEAHSQAPNSSQEHSHTSHHLSETGANFSPVLKSSFGPFRKRQRDDSLEDHPTPKRIKNLSGQRDEKMMNTVLDTILSEVKKKSKEKRLASLGSPASRRALFSGSAASPLGRSMLMDGPDHPLNRMLKSGPKYRKHHLSKLEESEDIIPKRSPEKTSSTSQDNRTGVFSSIMSTSPQSLLSQEDTQEQNPPSSNPPVDSENSSSKLELLQPKEFASDTSASESITTTPKKRSKVLLLSQALHRDQRSSVTSQSGNDITKDITSHSVSSQNIARISNLAKVIATVSVASLPTSKSYRIVTSQSPVKISAVAMVTSPSKLQREIETFSDIKVIDTSSMMSQSKPKTSDVSMVTASVSVIPRSEKIIKIASVTETKEVKESGSKNSLPPHRTQPQISAMIDLTLSDEDDDEQIRESSNKVNKISHAELKEEVEEVVFLSTQMELKDDASNSSTEQDKQNPESAKLEVSDPHGTEKSLKEGAKAGLKKTEIASGREVSEDDDLTTLMNLVNDEEKDEGRSCSTEDDGESQMSGLSDADSSDSTKKTENDQKRPIEELHSNPPDEISRVLPNTEVTNSCGNNLGSKVRQFSDGLVASVQRNTQDEMVRPQETLLASGVEAMACAIDEEKKEVPETRVTGPDSSDYVTQQEKPHSTIECSKERGSQQPVSSDASSLHQPSEEGVQDKDSGAVALGSATESEATDWIDQPEKQSLNLNNLLEPIAKEGSIQGSKSVGSSPTATQGLKLDNSKKSEHSMFDISQFFDDDDDVMPDRLSDTEIAMNDYLPEVLCEDAITALRQSQSETEDDDKESNVDEGLDELPDLTETPRSKRRRRFTDENSGQKSTLAHSEKMMSQLLERTFSPRHSSQESIMDSDWMKELDEIASADPNHQRNSRKRLRSTEHRLSLKTEPSFSAILADTAFSRSYKVHGASLKKLVREKKRDSEVDKMEKILLSDLKKGGFRRTLEQAEHGAPGSNIECDEDTKRAINLMKKDWGTLPILSSSADIFTSKKIKRCIHKIELKSYFDGWSLDSMTQRIRTAVSKLLASNVSKQTGYLNFLLNQSSTRAQTYKFLLDVLHCHQNCDMVKRVIQSNLRSHGFSQSPFTFAQFKSTLIDTGVSSNMFNDGRQRTQSDQPPDNSVCKKCLSKRYKTSANHMFCIAKVLCTTCHVFPELIRTPSEQAENAVFLLMLLQERKLRQTDIMEMIAVFFREIKNWDFVKYLIARRLIELCSKLNVLQSIAMRLNFNGERPHEFSRILSFAVLKLHVFGLEPQASKMDNYNDLEALLDIVDHFNPENLELLLVPEKSEEQIGSQKRSYYHLSLLLPMLNICIGDKCEDHATFITLDRIWSILRTMNKRIRDNGAIYRSQVKYELSLFTKNLRILIQKAPKTNKASIFKYLRSAPVKEEMVDTSINNLGSSSDSDDVDVTYDEDDDDEVKGQRPTRSLSEIDDEFRIAEVIKSRIIGSAGKD